MTVKPSATSEKSPDRTMTVGNLERQNVFIISSRDIGAKNNQNSSSSTNGTYTNDENVPPHQPSFAPIMSKKRTWKNLIALSIGFLLQFAAYNSIANVQSSVNTAKGIGVLALCAVYISFVFSCLLVPNLLISLAGCKWSIVLGMGTYIAYILANFYPAWGTMIPAAVVVGIGGAPLWTATSMYLTKLAVVYSDHHEKEHETEAIIVRIFGFFFSAFQCTHALGNAISSVILQKQDFDRDFSSRTCGSVYCNEGLLLDYQQNTTNAVTDYRELQDAKSSSSSQELYELCGIFLGFSVLATAVVAVFVDDFFKPSFPKREGLTRLLTSTLSLIKVPKQILLIPPTLLIGMMTAFVMSDYTKAYVTCPMGVHMVGYVMVSRGVAAFITSCLCSIFLYKIKRHAILIVAASVNGGVLIILLSWEPNQENIFFHLAVSGCLGISDVAWNSVINALYGLCFPQDLESAFANFNLWTSAGSIIMFALSNYICIKLKLYLLLSSLTLAIITYSILEMLLQKNTKKLVIN